MHDDERLETLREEIAARLEKVRGDLTDEEFAKLVYDVAVNARKSETRNQQWGTIGRSVSPASGVRA